MSDKFEIGFVENQQVTVACDSIQQPNRKDYSERKSYRQALDAYKAAKTICDQIIQEELTYPGVTRGSGILTRPINSKIDTTNVIAIFIQPNGGDLLGSTRHISIGGEIPGVIGLTTELGRPERVGGSDIIMYLQTREELVTILANLSDHPHLPTRSLAVSVLYRLGHDASPAIPKLISRLEEEKDVWVLLELVGIFKYLSEELPEECRPAIPALKKHIFDENFSTGLTAASALHNLGVSTDYTLPDLLIEIEDDDPEVRHQAVLKMGQAMPAMDEAKPLAIDALIKRLEEDPDPKVRFSAAGSLHHSAEAVPSLIASLDDPEELVVTFAAQSLGSIGEPAKPALPVLRKLASENKYPNHLGTIEQAIRFIEEESK